MSQLQITNAGLNYRNAVFAGDEVQNITHFVFANIDGQDETAPIDPNTIIPTNIVHTEPVKAVSRIDGNAIVMSAVMGYDVGDFDYNWYGAVATNANNEQILIAVVTTALQSKTKTSADVYGNYSAKSIVWRSQNIAEQLNITLSALPWQVQVGEFVSAAEFAAHDHNQYLEKTAFNTLLPFVTQPTISVFNRHNIINSNEYTAPLVGIDDAELQNNDWFSIRASNGQPVIKQANADETTAKFKRLADGAIDTQVTIVADDKNERVFVYNKELNVWEF
ncbi:MULTISPECIES: phage tail protein [unclassified Pseudoalteromonas]|uniref:phage tail-collar fiber domain-containing protein n=1 Tax=unclassified Pseudoalteromonas TaxID=194690 RepID=UPI00390CAC8C